MSEPFRVAVGMEDDPRGYCEQEHDITDAPIWSDGTSWCAQCQEWVPTPPGLLAWWNATLAIPD